MATINLLETVLCEGLTAASIDKEAGVIRGVKVLGATSRNGRKYADKAMNDAVRLYENMAVNLDHDRKEPTRERGFMEGTGVLKNVRREKTGGVYADLHYLKSHPASAVVVESAERFPESFGLSHNAEGIDKKVGSETIIESLTRVRSVDIVRNPATNKGLFESENLAVKKTIKQFIESQFPGKTAGCMLVESANVSGIEIDIDANFTGDNANRAAIALVAESILKDEKLTAAEAFKRASEVFESMNALYAVPEKKTSEPSIAEAVANAVAAAMKPLQESVSSLSAKLEQQPATKPKPLMESKFQNDAKNAPPKGTVRDPKDFLASASR